MFLDSTQSCCLTELLSEDVTLGSTARQGSKNFLTRMYTATNVRRNGNRPDDGQSGSRKARARAASEDVGCAHEYEKYAHLWAKQTRVRCCTRSWNGTIGQVTGLCGWKHTRARSRLDMWTPDYARATAPRKRNVSCTPYSPFSSLATYIRINRRKDGRGRCIPASSSDRGNENTSRTTGKYGVVV